MAQLIASERCGAWWAAAAVAALAVLAALLLLPHVGESRGERHGEGTGREHEATEGVRCREEDGGGGRPGGVDERQHVLDSDMSTVCAREHRRATQVDRAGFADTERCGVCPRTWLAGRGQRGRARAPSTT